MGLFREWEGGKIVAREEHWLWCVLASPWPLLAIRFGVASRMEQDTILIDNLCSHYVDRMLAN